MLSAIRPSRKCSSFKHSSGLSSTISASSLTSVTVRHEAIAVGDGQPTGNRRPAAPQ